MNRIIFQCSKHMSRRNIYIVKYSMLRPEHCASASSWLIIHYVYSVLKISIWLILPVVICLSQRLSHACLSTYLRHGETANGSLNQSWFLRSYAVHTRTTVVILELIRATGLRRLLRVLAGEGGRALLLDQDQRGLRSATHW